MNQKSAICPSERGRLRRRRAGFGVVAALAVALFASSALAAQAPASSDQSSSFVRGARDAGRAVGLTFHQIGQGAKHVGLEVGRGARDVGVEIGQGAAHAGRQIGQAAREGGKSFARAIRGE